MASSAYIVYMEMGVDQHKAQGKEQKWMQLQQQALLLEF